MMRGYWIQLTCVLFLSKSNTVSAFLNPVTAITATKQPTFLRAAASDDTATTKNNGLRIGFVGCGTIASAIAKGLATQSKIPLQGIAVTKRSESKSQTLLEAFPELVTRHDNNQDIVDQSDIVFICVLPQQTSEVLKELTFDDDQHTLVSLVSTAKIDDLVKDSELDASKVSKMICLPAVARHQGVCLLCSPVPNQQLENLFDAVGGVLAVQTEAELNACMMTTCVMGPIYGLMRTSRDWLVSQTNISKADASYLVAKQYQGAVQDAVVDCETDPDRLDNLIAEQTKGGLNEQALRNLDTLGGLEAYDKVMDAIVARINGDSDGSVE